jgi:hypothetical protein
LTVIPAAGGDCAVRQCEDLAAFDLMGGSKSRAKALPIARAKFLAEPLETRFRQNISLIAEAKTARQHRR